MLRQTGRTSRMIEEAKDLAAHNNVYIIALNATHVDLIRKSIGPGYKIKVISAQSGVVDWDRMQLYGTHDKVLFDHAALEDHFRVILEMIHRYDA